jgi:4,5-dihydroxyphthalate decarboxylase
MAKLRLSIAVGDYDRTRPIVDGRVPIDGVEPICMLQSPEEMFFRAFRHQAYDVSELSLSSYCVSVANGDPAYVAVPAFVSRAFRHSSIYIRTDRGIGGLADLWGRRIGIAEYQLTANVWARALMAEAGVAPEDVIWVRGGMDTPGRPEKMKIDLPAAVRVETAPADTSLNALLIAGAIDGFIGPRAPRCYQDGEDNIDRLFPDTMAAAEAYYRRTRIFPIMHVLGVRRSLAEDHPWLPGALFKAFSEAKRLAEAALADTSAAKVTMPFVEDVLRRARRLDPDLWSYGAAANAHVLDAFLAAHHAQGLSSRRLSVDALFHPSTMESFSL